MRELIMKRKRVITVVLALCIYFAVLTLISFEKSPEENRGKYICAAIIAILVVSLLAVLQFKERTSKLGKETVGGVTISGEKERHMKDVRKIARRSGDTCKNGSFCTPEKIICNGWKQDVSLFDILLVVFLLVLVIYDAYLIFKVLNPWGMNSDTATDISYRKISWEQKKLYPEGFIGPFYPLAMRTVLLYWIFYGITQNFLLAFQLENMTTLLLILGSLYYLMRMLKIKVTGRLISLCIFLVFLPGPVREVVFYPSNYYALLLITIILTCGFRLSLWKNFKDMHSLKEKPLWLPLCGILLLAAVLGYTTIQLAMFLYIPMLCVDICRNLLNFINQKEADRKATFMLMVSGLSLLLNVIFYAAVVHFHGDAFNQPDFWIGGIADWLNWNVLSAQIVAVLQTFGIAGGGKPQSIEGIQFLLSGCMVVLELTAVVWLLKKKGHPGDGNLTNELVCYWLAATGAMFLMQVLTGAQISVPRYYVVTALFLPIMCGAALTEWCSRRHGRFVFWPIACVMICLGTFFGTSVKQDAVRYAGQPPELSQVAAYIEENGYQYVTASFWNAGAITGYTNGAVDYQHSYGTGVYFLEPFNWLIDTRKYDQERQGEPNILLLTDEEETAIRNNDDYMYRMMEGHSEKVQEFGQYNLYRFIENPYTLIKKVKAQYSSAGLPSSDRNEKVDTPSSIGFFYQNAIINEQDELVSDGTEGFILWGPYTDSVSGIYDITLFYVIDSCEEGTMGSFDIALDAESYSAILFDNETTSTTLKNVDINEGHSFEVRVAVPEGMVIRVQSIEYRRK